MSTVGDPRQAFEVEDPYRFGWRMVRRMNEHGAEEWIQVPLTEEDLLHPEEEDFIVQSREHNADCLYLQSALLRRLADRPGTDVFHDIRIDWQVEGLRPHGPDVVVFEGATGPRVGRGATFRVVDQAARPLLVIEVTSPSTRRNDLTVKVQEYHRAGVPFYALVDADEDEESGERRVSILGYRWTAEGYLFVPGDKAGRLWLEPVRLWLAGEHGRAAFYNEEGARIPTEVELDRIAQEAEARAEEAALLAEEAVRARQEAEARAAELTARLQAMEAELQRLRGQE
jgi:hypothetical protein